MTFSLCQPISSLPPPCCMLLQPGIAAPQPGVVAPQPPAADLQMAKRATAICWPHPSRPGGPWPLPATPSQLQPPAARPAVAWAWPVLARRLGQSRVGQGFFHCSAAVGSMSIHNSLVKKELDWSSDADSIQSFLSWYTPA